MWTSSSVVLVYQHMTPRFRSGGDKMSSGIRYFDPPSGRPKSSLYSHVARVPRGELVFVAGQVSDKAGNRENEFDLQFHEVFDAIADILRDLGTDFHAVAEYTIFLVNPDHVSRFRELRNELFREIYAGEGYPPATLLVVQRLGEPEWLIEVKTVAWLAGSETTG
jgi:enamine deaminase RidA (YjgF/YER057c/UK114 family)